MKRGAGRIRRAAPGGRRRFRGRQPGGRTLRRLLACALVVPSLLLASLAIGSAAPASAATPGTAGVPQPGTVVFSEDFENTTADPEPESFSAPGSATYTGANPPGQTYSGSPDWIDGAWCNGVILSHDDDVDPPPAWTLANGSTTPYRCSTDSNVESYQFLRLLARAMGDQFGGGDANHVDSSITECGGNSQGCQPIPAGPTDGVMFRTNQPVPVTPNHFYTFSATTAYINCSTTGSPGTVDPQLRFALLDGTSTYTPIGGQLDACSTESTPTTEATVRYYETDFGSFSQLPDRPVVLNRLTADSAFQYRGSSLGVELYNETGATSGNDGAFDNVSVVDVTPQLDGAFSPSTVRSGQVSTLTYTVTNTAELDAKAGWNFTDDLPTGLRAVGSPTSSDCAGFDGSVVDGTSVRASGDLAAGQASCTVRVQVTAAQAGSYANGAANFPANTASGPSCNGGANQGLCGLRPPATATLTVTPAPPQPTGLALTKTADRTQVSTTGDVVTYTFRVTNTGQATLTGVRVQDQQSAPAAALDAAPACHALSSPAGTCRGPSVTLLPGQRAEFTATYTVTQADIDHGRITGTATAAGTAPGTGTTVRSAPATTTVQVAWLPGLSIAATADRSQVSRVGERIGYTFTVTNTGTPTLHSVRVLDTQTAPAGAASRPVCVALSAPRGRCSGPATTLLPGQRAEFTASYPVTQADIDSGLIAGSAVATGVPAGRRAAIGTSPARVWVPAVQAAGLTLDKTAQPTRVTRPGQVITYTFTVTNVGTVSIGRITVLDQMAGLSAVRCPSDSLAPGARMRCTATYSVTAADIAAGSIRNAASVTGVPGAGAGPANSENPSDTANGGTPTPGSPSGALGDGTGTGGMDGDGGTDGTGGSALPLVAVSAQGVSIVDTGAADAPAANNGAGDGAGVTGLAQTGGPSAALVSGGLLCIVSGTLLALAGRRRRLRRSG